MASGWSQATAASFVPSKIATATTLASRVLASAAGTPMVEMVKGMRAAGVPSLGTTSQPLFKGWACGDHLLVR